MLKLWYQGPPQNIIKFPPNLESQVKSSAIYLKTQYINKIQLKHIKKDIVMLQKYFQNSHVKY